MAMRPPILMEAVAGITSLSATARRDHVSGLALNIGQDGTGSYTGGAGGINAGLDDLGIWRRALTTMKSI